MSGGTPVSQVVLSGRHGEDLTCMVGPAIEEGTGMLIWRNEGDEEVVVRDITVRKQSGEETVYQTGQRIIPGQCFRIEGNVLS